MSAEEALAVHLVGEVTAPEQLMAAAGETMARICVAQRDVLVRTKAKALRRAGVDPTRATLDL